MFWKVGIRCQLVTIHQENWAWQHYITLRLRFQIQCWYWELLTNGKRTPYQIIIHTTHWKIYSIRKDWKHPFRCHMEIDNPKSRPVPWKATILDGFQSLVHIAGGSTWMRLSHRTRKQKPPVNREILALYQTLASGASGSKWMFDCFTVLRTFFSNERSERCKASPQRKWISSPVPLSLEILSFTSQSEDSVGHVQPCEEEETPPPPPQQQQQQPLSASRPTNLAPQLVATCVRAERFHWSFMTKFPTIWTEYLCW